MYTMINPTTSNSQSTPQGFNLTLILSTKTCYFIKVSQIECCVHRKQKGKLKETHYRQKHGNNKTIVVKK